ncbi:Aristolochene synthase from penicillium Roqueforti [Xylariaceae sp. AK1471]|nr:Aristolochene synthase from penicillium Roqueforti [Xylariaceae sp. AK1471]
MEYDKSIFPVACHPLLDALKKETDKYFIDNWPFPNGKNRDKFLKADYPLCAALYFPQARDDRISFAARLFGMIFLLDDVLETVSFEEGKAYQENLMSIIAGDEAPDPKDRIGNMYHDLWEGARASDQELANGAITALFVFMRSQTDERRADSMSLRQYLEYRDKDIGQAILCASLRFCLNIKLTPDELALVEPANVNVGKHILGINDIWSYDKEALAAKQVVHEEGGVLCNGVAILSTETGLSPASSKKVFYCICREWEAQHRQFAKEMVDSSEALRAYFQGLEYVMGGNEEWSKHTPRYNIGK